MENLKAPEGITVAPKGDIYVAETGTSRVRRFTPRGESVTLDLQVSGTKSIVASADGRYLFVSDDARRIWRFTQDGLGRKAFCTFADEGQPAGLALDEKGRRDIRWKKVSYIPQGSMHVLNPVRRIRDTFHDFIRTQVIHVRLGDRRERRDLEVQLEAGGIHVEKGEAAALFTLEWLMKMRDMGVDGLSVQTPTGTVKQNLARPAIDIAASARSRRRPAA